MIMIGTGAGLVGTHYNKEFKYVTKAALVANDKALAKLYQDSENGKVPYKLPFRAVDGSYNGCAKCTVAGLSSHGGLVGVLSSTTAASTSTTRAATTTTKSPATTKSPVSDTTAAGAGTTPMDFPDEPTEEDGAPPPMQDY